MAQFTTIQFRNRLGGIEYPGSREEATFRGPDQHRDASDVLDRLVASDPETWADAGLTLVTHEIDDAAIATGADAPLHPGHAVLRVLIPDTAARRAFVQKACSVAEWYPPHLIAAVAEANGRKPVNVSPEDARSVRAFIESI
jgi:hypothetical protein